MLLLRFALVSVIFTEYFAFSQALLDLNCINDYDTEMACQIPAENNCSEYKLDGFFYIQPQEMFTCHFEPVYFRACECKFRVNGFAYRTTFKANLSRKGNVSFTKDIETNESIKPKRPIIISVNMTENGNFLITWDTNYTHRKVFYDSLSAQLTYSVKGDTYNVTTDLLGKNQTKYEIVGRKLRPNSNYAVWARVITNYNNKSSDYSEPYSFSTPSSLQNILKIIVPVSCFILVFFIFTMYHCYLIITREWWDKIPVPKIAPIFEKKVPHFPSFQNEISTVHLETSKLDHTADETWNSFSNVDISSQHSQHSLGQSGDLSQVIFAQTGYESVEETGSKCEDQAANLHMPTSNKLHKDLQPNNSGSDMRMDCGNSSGSSFSNKCYMASTSGGSCFLDQPIRHSSDMEPLIPTDFEYGPCNGCSGPADTILTQLPPSSSDITVVLGYQSTSEVLDHGNEPEIDASVDQAFISFHTDVSPGIEINCSYQMV
ncbi:uncharacterized protein LOC143517119 isoform X2 [Brachyhypopomus gauderio]|uniref:uncharacterized protein LOC143517119 isoform X2 n=1 Tax=Brachyhypopomus gauderio TaxID=698409 RepID=UPI0040420193